MFERMTENSRLAIFWARKEAHEQRSPVIKSEHLLFGLVRADAPIIQELIGQDLERVRLLLEFSGARKEDLHQDLPLDEESKKAFKFALEEADRVGDWLIGTQHFVAGFLLLPQCEAAKILLESGLTLELVREKIAQYPRQ